MDRADVFALYRAHVNAGKIDAFDALGIDVVIGDRCGIRFGDAFDPDRTWVNCHCNGGVFNLGHRHPVVLDAVQESLRTVDLGNHHLPAPGRAELARRLSRSTGDRLPGVVFGVSGGEAVDVALKVARGATGRTGIVSISGGYHGHTGLSLAAGDPEYRDPFNASLEGFTQVPFDDLPALESSVDDATAAVIVEPIPATLGMPIPSPGYLESVQQRCRDRGVVFIVDEVQTGLGRTGRMWAHQHWGLEPDVLVTGKGLSGGVYPITATLMTRDLHAIFEAHPFSHISTFGGAEPGCAAGIAVMDVVEAPGFLEHVIELGEHFEAGFAGLPFETRRLGLMMGLAFGGPDAGILAAKMLFDRGVFAVYANNDTAVLQFLPPLVTTTAEADDIIDTVRTVFG